MAAFSSFHHSHPFLLDLDDPSSALFSQIYQSQAFQNVDQGVKVAGLGNSEASVLRVAYKNSVDSSSIVTHYKHDDTGKHVAPNASVGKKRKYKDCSSSSSAQSKDMREAKGKKGKRVKKGETKKRENKDEKKTVEEAPTGYIHVRARRGQATDSHSLAERVRRERISERMKLLQTLVPGCEKVTGKALMLDEIINYVQSLQNQVEFLSMKLASVNPMFYDFGVDLESFMIRPDQNLSSLPSPLQNMQQCSPTAINGYPSLENSLAQIPNPLPQISRQVSWEMDDQRQKTMDPHPFH